MSPSPKHILIIGVDWLGDVLFSTPLIRAIRKAYPSAFIAYSTPKRCVSLLESNPHINQVIAYDESVFIFDLFKNFRFYRLIKPLRFDMAVFLHRSSTRAFWVWLSGIKMRIGYKHPKRDWMINKQLLPQENVHRIEHYLGLLEGLGIPKDGMRTEFNLSSNILSQWMEFKKSYPILQKKYHVIHPGGNWNLKRWPIKHFIELIQMMLKDDKHVVICGTNKEKHLADKIVNECKGVLSLCGKTNMNMLSALLNHSECLISNDSGPIHLAAALGTPIVGLFGPTRPDLTGPLTDRQKLFYKNFGCDSPCYYDECHNRVCMERLLPKEVFEATREVVA